MIACCEASYRSQPDFIYDCNIELVGLKATTKYLQVKRKEEEALAA